MWREKTVMKESKNGHTAVNAQFLMRCWSYYEKKLLLIEGALYRSCSYMHSVVRPRGFEPLTYGLEGRCSIQLSYERKIEKVGVRGLEPPISCSQSRRLSH
jgi:hypothetical protein